MSFRDVPPFDMLLNQNTPYSGFGTVFVPDSGMLKSYLLTYEQAIERVRETFKIQFTSNYDTVYKLEDIIHQMWLEGWNPIKGDINLFTTDFGCILTECLRISFDGSLVLRSSTDLTHASLWWPTSAIESFPFYVIYKRLYNQTGNTITSYVEGVRKVILETESL